jgi:hypothetical protein
MPKGKGYTNPFKGEKKAQSYADLLILRGLKAGKEVKSAVKETKKRGIGKSIGGAISHAKRMLRRKPGKPKSPDKKTPSAYSTTRTEAVEKSVGDVAQTKQYRRMKGHSK